MVGLIALCALYIYYQELVDSVVKQIFEWDSLNLVLWAIPFCSFFIQFLSEKNGNVDNNGLIFRHFGHFGDYSFTVVTFGVASNTGASLLKVFFVQNNFEDIFSQYLGQIDKYSILVVSLFLLGYPLFTSIRVLLSALHNQAGSSVKTEVAVDIKS